MYCTKCGHELSSGVRFCGNCGERIKEEPSDSPTSKMAQPDHTAGSNAVDSAVLNEGVKFLVYGNKSGQVGLVKDGFNWWAFLFGIFWALYKGMFKVAGAILAIIFAISLVEVLVIELFPALSSFFTFLYLFLSLGVGGKAKSIESWHLSQNGYELVGEVIARNLEDAVRVLKQDSKYFGKDINLRRFTLEKFLYYFLIPMMLTYVWRYALVLSAIEEDSFNPDDVGIMATLLLALCYGFMIMAAKSWGDEKRKTLWPFPLIGGIFDIVIPFVPLIPTVFSIITIVMAVQVAQRRNSKGFTNET
jgi:hypothetical protein